MSEEQGGAGGSFEERLDAARDRHGLDRAASAERGAGEPPEGANPMAVGLRVGVELVSALVVALAIGYGLDRWLHTRPLFLILFVMLGGAAGVLNVWRLFAPRGGGFGRGTD